MPTDVRCEVSNCVHWGRKNVCMAETIYVVSHTGKEAKDQIETDCHTFKPFAD